jgi:hypothetical protein
MNDTINSPTVTVVTAYYEMKSKFTTEKYWGWIRNFCKIPFNVVIFTSTDLIGKMKDIRASHGHGDKNTRIVPLEFSDLEHYKKYKNLYTLHHNLDNLKRIHSPELYIVWAEKVKFIMKAIELNHFNSNKYVWCDIGAFRLEKFMNDGTYLTFPRYDKIVDGKINWLLLQDFTESDIKFRNNLIGQEYGAVRLGGGIQGGDVESWKKYEKLWDDALSRYFQNYRFAGQDQCIMGTIFLEEMAKTGGQSQLFHIVRPPPENVCIDPWFYLLQHWS